MQHVNFRSYYISHLIGKFSLQALNLISNREASNNFFPIPLTTSNLHILDMMKRLLTRVTTLGALAIADYKAVLISRIPNALPDIEAEVRIRLVPITRASNKFQAFTRERKISE